MAIRWFQVRSLETHWLRHATWLGPLFLSLFLRQLAVGGYSALRLGLVALITVSLLAWPIAQAWRARDGALTEHQYIRAYGMVFLMLILDIAVTGGLRSPITSVIVIMAITANLSFGGRREGRWFSNLVLVTLLSAWAAPKHWFGTQLPVHLEMQLRLWFLIGGVLAARAQAVALADAYQRASNDLDRLRENVLGDARQRALGLESMGAKVAHELKNPLAALKALLQVCVRSPSEPRTSTRLEAALGEVARLETLLREYLSFSRPLEDLRPQAIDLGRIVEDVAVLLDARARARSVQLKVRGTAELRADPRRLREALINLVTNALEATPAGGRVTVEAESTPAGSTLRIRDTGEGIAPDRIANLGEGQYTTRHDGTGLGVALARAAIAQHSGTLSYASEVGRGTTVTIDLPRLPAPSSTHAPGTTGTASQA